MQLGDDAVTLPIEVGSHGCEADVYPTGEVTIDAVDVPRPAVEPVRNVSEAGKRSRFGRRLGQLRWKCHARPLNVIDHLLMVSTHLADELPLTPVGEDNPLRDQGMLERDPDIRNRREGKSLLAQGEGGCGLVQGVGDNRERGLKRRYVGISHFERGGAVPVSKHLRAAAA